MYDEVKYLISGDTGILMEFGDEISPEINKKINGVVRRLELEQIPGVMEWIPSYRSILIKYNPLIIRYNELIEKLEIFERQRQKDYLPHPFVTEIPTVYGGAYGPDIERVAEHNSLSIKDVIAIHSEAYYLIYMLGFTPGFPYLGGMSERIAAPRLKIPREVIPAGSVGIAGSQTGIYPIKSPGGWQLIGRTPLLLFNPAAKEPFLFRAGDYIKFIPINIEAYRKIEQQITCEEYQVVRYPLERRIDAYEN